MGDVGSDPDHPDACGRCATTVGKLDGAAQ